MALAIHCPTLLASRHCVVCVLGLLTVWQICYVPTALVNYRGIVKLLSEDCIRVYYKHRFAISFLIQLLCCRLTNMDERLTNSSRQISTIVPLNVTGKPKV